MSLKAATFPPWPTQLSRHELNILTLPLRLLKFSSEYSAALADKVIIKKKVLRIFFLPLIEKDHFPSSVVQRRYTT